MRHLLIARLVGHLAQKLHLSAILIALVLPISPSLKTGPFGHIPHIGRVVLQLVQSRRGVVGASLAAKNLVQLELCLICFILHRTPVVHIHVLHTETSSDKARRLHVCLAFVGRLIAMDEAGL